MRVSPFFILPALLLSACATTPTPEPDTGLYIRGTARVISVDQTLGRALLDYQNHATQAYWQTETALAQGGSIVSAGPLRPPIGQYGEPDIKAHIFTPKPGDTIQFAGMRTGNSIFLQAVAVLSQK